ncbi:MAG: 3'(2'),5'-bisphosphate nucleotidase CysQ [Polyangia bacterium]|jgi:3'(2'), 5'-bisphosphate nucleotidase
MQQPDLSRELELARSVAREAAALVASFKGRPLEVHHKSGGEPVSQADLAASELIVRRLREAFPEDAVLSEELPDDGARLANPRVWMVDPIDGTRDFLAGEPGYVVMIGLCRDGRPVVGALAQPEGGALWLGAVGAGAWKESVAGTRQPLSVSTVSQPQAIRLVSSKSHRSEYYARLRAELGITDELALGSVGLKVALVAEGVRDLYVYPGSQTKIWDSCAPEAILTAAGGRLTDSDGGALAYARSGLQNPRGVVASNGHVHQAALAAMARLRVLTRY